MLLCRWNWHGIVLSRIFISQNNQKTERLKRWHDTMLIINKVPSVSPSQSRRLSSLWKQEWVGVTAYLFTSWRSVSWPTPTLLFPRGLRWAWQETTCQWCLETRLTTDPTTSLSDWKKLPSPGRAGICVASSSRGAKLHWDSGSDRLQCHLSGRRQTRPVLHTKWNHI